MTSQELKLKVAASNYKDLYNGLEAKIFIDFLDYNQTLKGITTLFQFCDNQIEKWNKYENNLPELFLTSKRNFQVVKEEIVRLVDSLELGSYSPETFRSSWNNTISTKLIFSNEISEI